MVINFVTFEHFVTIHFSGSNKRFSFLKALFVTIIFLSLAHESLEDPWVYCAKNENFLFSWTLTCKRSKFYFVRKKNRWESNGSEEAPI